ncbi:hypothetical protein vBRpoSV10_122 [Ruegeria phage vB_RpoS-V10]|nr:hypothetical protein vBRpoSV10_122 [Ruegeria phage vB_RpoS-V10]
MFTDIRKKLGAAASEIDLTAAKAKIAGTVKAAKDLAADAADTVSNRVSNPADAYDEALDAVFEKAGSSEYAGRGVCDLVSDLRRDNPYR